MLVKLRQDLNKLKNPQKAKDYQWFFKTGPGEYGAGDIFLGLNSAQVKIVAKKYINSSFNDLQQLLNSKIHEERMCALRILAGQYKQIKKKKDKNDEELKKIFDFYKKNAKKINNWDLVDTSAPYIIGDYLLNKDRKILYKFARSRNLWEKRIAIISTMIFIDHYNFKDTLKISEILLKDQHDLIHKAVGWMLRELGKRDKKVLCQFLNKYTLHMPRTMLRYAIEKFPEKERKFYLNKK